MIATCEKHGLRYDPAQVDGCVVCRREATAPPTTPRSRAVFLLVAVVVVVGGVAFALLRSPAHAALKGTLGQLQCTNGSGRHGSYFLPTSYATRPLPLLVALHGTGGGGRMMVDILRSRAEEQQFIIAAPDSGLHNGAANWEVGDHALDITDDFTHAMTCIRELMAMPDVRIDTTHVLVAGHSGGGSSAPYFATNESLFTHFAVLHGGVFPGGLGKHAVRGWFSTGDGDTLRTAAGVKKAADSMTGLRFSDVQFHVFTGGHPLIDAELDAMIAWWLGT